MGEASISEESTIIDGRPGLKPKSLSGNAGGVSARSGTATSRKNSSKQQRRQRPRPPKPMKQSHILRRRKGH